MDFLKNSYKKFIDFAYLFDNVTAVTFALDLNLNGAATIIKETYKVTFDNYWNGIYFDYNLA